MFRLFKQTGKETAITLATTGMGLGIYNSTYFLFPSKQKEGLPAKKSDAVAELKSTKP